MNCRFLIVVMIVMVCLFSGGCENADLAESKKDVQAMPEKDSLKEKIMKINSILEKAEMENDKETLFKYFTDDVIICPGLGPAVKGIAAVRISYDENKKHEIKYRSYTAESEDIWECSGKIYERGTFGMSFTYKDHPRPRAYYGSYFTIWISIPATNRKVMKMNLALVFAYMAFAAVIWYVVASIVIYNELKKRNIKVYFIFLNVMNPFYAYRYKKITEAETGKTGSLFYHWIIAINMALVFGITSIILKNIY